MGYSPQGRKESDTTERLHFLYALSPYPELTFKIRNWLFQSITRKSEIKLKKEEKTFTPHVHLEGHKITADGDYSHEIKRRLLLGRKIMTNLDSTFKSRDITLPTKVHLVKAMVGFSSGHVWM